MKCRKIRQRGLVPVFGWLLPSAWTDGDAGEGGQGMASALKSRSF